jgi:hypothetical protein
LSSGERGGNKEGNRLKPWEIGSIELFAPLGACHLTLDFKNNIYVFGRFDDNLIFS